MLPPLEKDINCYRYKAEAYIVIETSIPEQVEDTVTHHPAGFKCFKDSLTCEKSLTFPAPQRKWNLFFRERPKNSSQFYGQRFRGSQSETNCNTSKTKRTEQEFDVLLMGFCEKNDPGSPLLRTRRKKACPTTDRSF
ncbi:hypothetical protein SAMN05720765_10531 [Fibrobacter sp. UWH6]|nr:hypothetical protein SAMN05720765_10531 [Fibrobacter sp. UWH6]